MGPDGVDNDGEHDDIVNWEKEYNCILYGSCPTLCERAKMVSYTVFLVSLMAIFVVLVYSIHRRVRLKKHA